MATVDIPDDQPIEVTVGAPTFVTGVGGIDGITEARAVELDAQTLAAAKAYADEIDTVPLEYVDDGDADAVAQAKTYTDTALVEATAHAESYTDDAIAGIDFPDTGVPEATIDAKDQAVREHADAGDQTIRELIASLPAPVTNWSGITGKPTTFTPAAHTHTVSQITDMPATPTWGTLGGKPTTFPPSAHQHAASDITSGVFAQARLGTGTASASTVLYGDGEWKSAPTGGGSGGGFPMPQAPAGHSDVVVPPWSTATTRSVGGTIVQPLVMASSRVYDRFAIRAVGAAAGVTVLLQLWRLEGTMWRYMPIGTFDLSSAGLKEITGRWVLPAGQYMYGAYTASNTGNWVAGVPHFGGPQTLGGLWPPSDARQSIWWANASQPVTVDLPGLDQVSLTSVGVVNSPNSWGGGHLPALWARTAV